MGTSSSQEAPNRRTVLIGTSLGDSPVCRHFAALAQELSNLSYGVSLLVHGPETDRSYIDDRISVLRWPSARPTGLPDALFFFRLVTRTRPCCVIGNFGSTTLMLALGALGRVPIRIYWHHSLSTQCKLDSQRGQLLVRLQTWRARILWRLATNLVANSAAAKHDLVDVYRMPVSRCQVFWNCLADPFPINGSPSPPRSANRHKFLCVGRFAPSKGQDLVIRAIATARSKLPGIVVEFVGDGEAQEKCARLAAELGVSHQCLFSGYLPHAEVLEKMASARATVVPSRAEAFGLVCIESMAVGVPVIGSRTGGITEVIRDGKDGLLFPPEDHEAVARLMIEIGNNDLLHSRMALECRRRFLQYFELSEAVKSQTQWLCALIEERM